MRSPAHSRFQAKICLFITGVGPDTSVTSESDYARLGANFLPETEEHSGTFQKRSTLYGSLLPPGGGVCASNWLLRLACHLQRALGVE